MLSVSEQPAEYIISRSGNAPRQLRASNYYSLHPERTVLRLADPEDHHDPKYLGS
jgi:hypothetical protein